MTSRAQQLRQLLETTDGALLVPAAPNALSARVVEEAGFEVERTYGWFDYRPFRGQEDMVFVARRRD